MINSKLTAARAIFPLLTLGLVVPACMGTPESGDEEFFEGDSSENVAEATEALTTVTTTRGTLANPNCNSASTVSLSLGSNVTADKLAPWKTLAAAGTFSLGSGANGVQVRYWIDGNSNTSQTDAVASNAASGSWSWTSSNNLTCAPHTFTVCAIPYVNGNACGDLDGTTSSGYRVCRQVSFRGCSNAVGIIPDSGASCPAGSDTLTRYMDDENVWPGNNDNAYSGWDGAMVSQQNTHLEFCRVDGRNFKPLTTCTSNTVRDYAVLKLGSVCPNGSVGFSKLLRNENVGNSNGHSVSSGDYYPNVYSGDTDLHFCLFGAASSLSATMDRFPAQGIAYGVFGRSTLVSANEASDSGWFRSDNEDNESNVYNGGTVSSRASQIISDSTQTTTFYTAKVKTATNQGTGDGCPVCGNGTCDYPETRTSCATDCERCGDGYCGIGETASNCNTDCGYCGDGICDFDEASWCASDCGGGGDCCEQLPAKAGDSSSLVQPEPCICNPQ